MMSSASAVAVYVVRPSGGVGLRAGLGGTPADAHVRLAAPCHGTLADEGAFDSWTW